MAGSSIRFDFSQVTAAMARMRDRMPKAAARAINRSTVSARAAMIPAIVADTGLKATKVRQAMTIRNATSSNLQSALIARGARIPLIDFKGKGPEPSRGRAGTSVTAGVRGGRQSYPGAFIARMPANANAESGHRGIYKRKGTGARTSRGGWSKNLPIRQLFGPSIVHVFDKFHQLGIDRYNEALPKNLASERRFILGV